MANLGYATEPMLNAANLALLDSESPLDRELRRYLSDIVEVSLKQPTPLALVGYSLSALEKGRPEWSRSPLFDEIQQSTSAFTGAEGMPRGVLWGIDFIKTILKELRDLLCGKGKKPKALSANSHALLSALAALIAKKLGVADSTAIALAVLVLVALGRATKNAFCKMTKKEVLMALAE
jgi:hypothetical protein